MSETTFKQCCVNAFGIRDKEVHDELEYASIPQWDSVGHMALVAELEQAFDIVFDPEEIAAIGTVRQARHILEKHGIHFGAAR